MAQGQRLYLRFNSLSNTSDLINYRGMRLKKNTAGDRYWVLGRDEYSLNSTGVAYIDPLNPTSNPPTEHDHYFTQQPSTRHIYWASDFDLNDQYTLMGSNSIAIIALRRDANYLPVQEAVSLFGVSNAAGLPLTPAPGNSFDYDMTSRTEVPWHSNAIKYDPTAPSGPRYAIAWNLIDPATVGGGTNLMDWGIASIDASTMAVIWSKAWNGTDAAQHEDVRDLVYKQMGLGYYATCGVRRNFTTGIQSGLVTSVSRITGNLAYQRVLTPPTGFALELNSLTVIPGALCAEYVVVGSLLPNPGNPAPKRVYIASITCSGAVNWSWALALSNSDDAEGFRHCKMLDGDYVIAGRITHKNGAPTSGLLVKVRNKTLDDNVNCSGGVPLIEWWAQYDTHDPAQGGSSGVPNANVELIDVTPIVRENRSIPDTENDVAAVGTAEMTHSGNVVKDVLWLEAETNLATNEHGISRDDGTPFGASCISHQVDWVCEEISITVTSLDPKDVESLQTDETDMVVQADEPFRFCDFNNRLPEYSTAPKFSDYSSEDERLNVSTTSYRLRIVAESDVANVYLNAQYPDNLELGLYNINGQKVTSISTGWCVPGPHFFQIPTGSLQSGIYMLRIVGSYVNVVTSIPVLR